MDDCYQIGAVHLDPSRDKIRQLEALGAGQFKHINGSLLEHFKGTRELLAQWHAPMALQDAGLFHAAYSTAGFGYRMLDIEQRHTVAAIIGERAEEIVYHFCACDREIFYPALESANTPPFPDRFTGENRKLAPQLMSDLCELTVANEVEIATRNENFRRKHAASRFAIYSGMFPHLSTPARSAVEEVFGS